MKCVNGSQKLAVNGKRQRHKGGGWDRWQAENDISNALRNLDTSDDRNLSGMGFVK
jgi:hypothetical protein